MAEPSPKFKVGDVVVLKSGSPQMTVKRIAGALEGSTTYQVLWYNEGLPMVAAPHFADQAFPEDALELAGPSGYEKDVPKKSAPPDGASDKQ